MKLRLHPDHSLLAQGLDLFHPSFQPGHSLLANFLDPKSVGILCHGGEPSMSDTHDSRNHAIIQGLSLGAGSRAFLAGQASGLFSDRQHL